MFVCACLLYVMSCHCTSQWMNIKTVQPGIAKTVFHITPACLCYLPPRPKLLPLFGLPKPPLTGRLVEGHESANQGRPGSPAFNSPGRLQGCLWRELRQRTGDILKCPTLVLTGLLIFSLLHQQKIDVKTHSAYSHPWSHPGNNKQHRDMKWQVYKSDFCLLLTPPPLTLPRDTKQA